MAGPVQLYICKYHGNHLVAKVANLESFFISIKTKRAGVSIFALVLLFGSPCFIAVNLMFE